MAALASWLDARAHGGQWLVRIEDVDAPRCIEGMGQTILDQLATLGLQPDEEPVWQSRRTALYQSALDRLITNEMAYPCQCSRKDIELALAASGRGRARGSELVYPGTCRSGLHGQAAPAWRLRTDRAQSANSANAGASAVQWLDRRLGAQSQEVERAVGDFPLKRADGCFTYQLAVVVDDAAQGISHVVRGEDLADNTARQILLQRALHLPTPHYLHTPLVRGANGEKLSKQNGAAALDLGTAASTLAALNAAAAVLGLPPHTASDARQALAQWVDAWRRLYNSPRD